MAAPNKKIRVTFLWADEAAVVQDFNAKYSQKLVDWANAFYGKHGFELDVQPAPGGTAKEAYRYCLAKSDGYEPDIASAEEFAARLLKMKKPTLLAWLKAYDDIRTLEGRETAKQQELDAALSQLATLPLGEISTRLDALRVLFDELQQITDALAEQNKLYTDLGDKLDDIDRQYAKEKTARDFDTPVRIAIGLKVLRSLSLGLLTHVKTGQENPALLDATRLKEASVRTWTWTRQALETLGRLATGRLSPKTLSGPIGIAKASAQAAREGAFQLFFMVAFISLQVGLLNLILPFIPFDGGHLALLVTESVMRRDLSERAREWVMNAGFGVVILLIALVFYSDLSKLSFFGRFLP